MQESAVDEFAVDQPVLEEIWGERGREGGAEDEREGEEAVDW